VIDGYERRRANSRRTLQVFGHRPGSLRAGEAWPIQHRQEAAAARGLRSLSETDALAPRRLRQSCSRSGSQAVRKFATGWSDIRKLSALRMCRRPGRGPLICNHGRSRRARPPGEVPAGRPIARPIMVECLALQARAAGHHLIDQPCAGRTRMAGKRPVRTGHRSTNAGKSRCSRMLDGPRLAAVERRRTRLPPGARTRLEEKKRMRSPARSGRFRRGRRCATVYREPA
jgi:hypothetical protein